MEARDVSRRNFLKTTTTAALAAGAAAGVSTAARRARGADGNSKIRIGFVGPGGRGFGAHVRRLTKLAAEGQPIELAAVCDVYNEHRDRAAAHIQKHLGRAPEKYADYRDMYAKANLDAVCIATPDHWHAKQAIDALEAGMDVYCEKPMTKTVEEAIEVMRVWKKSGRVMQVGVQSTSLPVWNEVNALLRAGKLGKVLMYQTEYFRNSSMGQWRYYKLTEKMTPKNINWKLWLGSEEGLAESRPFDREIYAQWRRFWPFGSGMFTDLFVHRTTTMLKGTGLRFPGRVVGAGGVFLEYDGRGVPDVATVVSDFPEGVQGMVTATMACAETPIRHVIRGHFGSFVFDEGDGYQFAPERPQVTFDSSLKKEDVAADAVPDTTYAHFQNWIEAMLAGDPMKCNNPTDLGAAAVANVVLGARSYREGKIFHFDADTMSIYDGDSTWAKRWEQMSRERQKPNHIPGWTAGDYGSTLVEPSYMKLAGPWINGKDPAKS